ncbi:MAG: hypothetical protein JST82_15665 [Bacteroidetes bacterium]|nr:hypothetical protein [Bacteroidota bacterium]
MKKSIFILTLLAILATISGYMLHKVSWVGRLGINLFYDEYQIFKSWWKSALLVYGIYLILYFFHWLINKKSSNAVLAHVLAILIAICGLYYTYNDFRHDWSHKIAGERFHIGFYLFWMGWIVISLFFIFQRKQRQ